MLAVRVWVHLPAVCVAIWAGAGVWAWAQGPGAQGVGANFNSRGVLILGKRGLGDMDLFLSRAHTPMANPQVLFTTCTVASLPHKMYLSVRCLLGGLVGWLVVWLAS